MKQTNSFTVHTYAYAILRILTSDYFEGSFRASCLTGGKSPEEREVISDALTILENDGF